MFASIAPYIGYLASVLLMIGLLVTTDLKFRIWNGLGCLFFIFYALIIGAMPVLLTNAVLLAINIVYLFKILRRKEVFDTAEINANDQLALKFLSFYKEDIAGYFPGFDPGQLQGNLNIVVLRDLVIANLFSGKLDESGNLDVVLNYTTPKYRDYKVGRFLFGNATKVLANNGVKTVRYKTVANKSHAEFLIRSGFTQNDSAYFKEIQ